MTQPTENIQHDSASLSVTGSPNMGSTRDVDTRPAQAIVAAITRRDLGTVRMSGEITTPITSEAD